MNFKNVRIYYDVKGTIYLIPTGISRKFNVPMDIHIVNTLVQPITEDELDALLYKTLDQCYSLYPEEDSISPIERFLKVRGYSKAVKDKKYVSLGWNTFEGYSVTPTQRSKGKKGYVHLESLTKTFTLEPGKGQLARAVLQAIDESRID